MMNKSRRWLMAILMCCAMALLATGCDQLKKETETEVQTEAPTEPETETEEETEAPTEAPTEEETEAPTEAETEPISYTTDTTVDAEQAAQVEFDTLKVMYALDALNVRDLPGTSGDIFAAYEAGDSITVVGETTNWYMVEVDGWDTYGYVYKGYVGASADAEVSDGSAGTSTGSSDSASTSTSSGATEIDTEYGVEFYAESFNITATAGANMRAEPSQDGEIINTIASDTVVLAVGYTDRWYKITYDGMTGYVNKNLFSAE